MTVLSSVLIANRGEIALRVMHSCAARGIRTIAVYTDLDAQAMHVRTADAAVRVDSYLDVDQVIAAAVSTGAQAIHPGYGFLSERADFARAVEAAGLVFIGPSADVMDAMARKDHAREIAERAGVPVVPRGEDAGFPVLVKAAAGGGGKGMRIVRAADELDDAMAAARREASAAFGDDTLLVEKLVEHGRHIEVQVVGDHHGTVLHFGERDCSAQRRHQKVLEESPAPTLTPELRERILAAGVDLAREVGYTNVGTVEFLLDTDTDDFYFLEMNTRLQVEHPVTESVFGVDLVDVQLEVAAGETIAAYERDLEFDDFQPAGHAIEARVYAEDAFGGFLPQAGTATSVHWPSVRVDHSLESGQEVSTSYDPMLGKIVVHGPDREAARLGLVAALDGTAILGLTTNAGFLRQLVASDAFRDAAIETSTLDEMTFEAPDPDLARLLEAWAEVPVDDGPWRSDGWRSAGPARARVVGHEVREISRSGEQLVLEVDGERVRGWVRRTAAGTEVVVHGQRHVLPRPGGGSSAAALGDGTLTSPMPGSVIDVRVAVGAEVTAGDVLGTVEAMKMEHALRAPFDGTVVEVAVAAGAQVALGDVLFVVGQS